MKKITSNFILLICSVLLFTTFIMALGDSVAAKSAVFDKEVKAEESLEKLLEKDSDFDKFLNGIENLPHDIEMQGAEKVASWLTENMGIEVIADGDNLIVPSLANIASDLAVVTPEYNLNSDLIGTMGVWDCIIAVGI